MNAISRLRKVSAPLPHSNKQGHTHMTPNTPPGLSTCPPALTPAQAAWERISKKYAHSSGLEPTNAAVTFCDSGSRSHRNDIVVDFRLTGFLLLLPSSYSSSSSSSCLRLVYT